MRFFYSHLEVIKFTYNNILTVLYIGHPFKLIYRILFKLFGYFYSLIKI